jgi:hypothetical protein
VLASFHLRSLQSLVSLVHNSVALDLDLDLETQVGATRTVSRTNDIHDTHTETHSNLLCAGSIWEVSKRRPVPALVNTLSVLFLLQLLVACIGITKAISTPWEADDDHERRQRRAYIHVMKFVGWGPVMMIGLVVLLAAVLIILMPRLTTPNSWLRCLTVTCCCCLFKCHSCVPLSAMVVENVVLLLFWERGLRAHMLVWTVPR